MPLLKLLESPLLKHWLMMEFVAVKLKIIASLGGLCGDYQRGVEYVQEKHATEISISGGIWESWEMKKSFSLPPGRDPQGMNCLSGVLCLV